MQGFDIYINILQDAYLHSGTRAMMEQTRLPASTAPPLRALQDPALSAGL